MVGEPKAHFTLGKLGWQRMDVAFDSGQIFSPTVLCRHADTDGAEIGAMDMLAARAFSLDFLSQPLRGTLVALALHPAQITQIYDARMTLSLAPNP